MERDKLRKMEERSKHITQEEQKVDSSSNKRKQTVSRSVDDRDAKRKPPMEIDEDKDAVIPTP